MAERASIIAYVESKAASMREHAARNATSSNSEGMIQQAIALEALASDLRAKLHEVEGERVG